MLTEVEIFLAIDNVPITQKYVVGVGRAIERAVLEKHGAEVEAILNDADDWARYVVEDFAPKRLRTYLEQAMAQRAAIKPPAGAGPHGVAVPVARHCQTGNGDVCRAGQRDGIVCPPESCDIDDGTRPPDGVKEFPAPLTPLVREYLEVSDAHTEWLTKDVPGKRFIELHRTFKARLAALDAHGVAVTDHQTFSQQTPTAGKTTP